MARRHAIVGRGHAERLLPLIADFPDKGRADRIAVDIGPGSFTGVRIGLAAARALSFAWGAALTGYSTLSIIARSDEHTSELQSLMRISYAVFCLKKKKHLKVTKTRTA